MAKPKDHKIIVLAARSMSHSDIAEYVQDIYGLDTSKTLISNIIDQVISKAIAEESLQTLEEKWGKKYRLWNQILEKQLELSAYFKYAPEVRKIIYTTHIIASFHS